LLIDTQNTMIYSYRLLFQRFCPLGYWLTIFNR